MQKERLARYAPVWRGRGIHAAISHRIHIEAIVGQQRTAAACAARRTTTATTTRGTIAAIELLRGAARLLRVQSVAVLTRYANAHAHAHAHAEANASSGSGCRHSWRMQIKWLHIGAERG